MKARLKSNIGLLGLSIPVFQAGQVVEVEPFVTSGEVSQLYLRLAEGELRGVVFDVNDLELLEENHADS